MDEEIRSALAGHKVKEVTQVYLYRGWLDDAELEIRILDRGLDDDDGHQRFSCMVTREDGTEATGNPQKNIYSAISGVHWQNFVPLP